MLSILFSAIVWIVVVIASLILFVGDFTVWLLTVLFDKRLWVLHRYSTFWALLYLWANPFWKIKFEGAQNVRKGETYVIVCNHQSALDIALLYRLKMHFKWVAKRELFRVPVIGWNLWLNRYITVERSNPKSAIKMIQQAIKHLNQRSSVLLFAEGTRTTDGKIKRFKDGAFIIAKKANRPILPVVIDGTLEALPKKGFVIKGRQTFKVKILPAIEVTEFMDKSPSELAKMAKEMIEKEHRLMAPKYYKE